MFTMLRQRRLRWLGHVRRMNDDRIPKTLLYGELSAEKRNLGRPQLRYRDVRKRDMNELNIDKNKWEELATDRSNWRSYLQTTLKFGKKINALEKKRRLKKKKYCQPCSCQHCDKWSRSFVFEGGLLLYRLIF